MFSVTASLGRPALTVASSGRPTGRTSKKGKRFEAKFGAKIKEVKKDLDKMLGDAKESFEKFEKMHKENVDKLGDIANHHKHPILCRGDETAFPASGFCLELMDELQLEHLRR